MKSMSFEVKVCLIAFVLILILSSIGLYKTYNDKESREVYPNDRSYEFFVEYDYYGINYDIYNYTYLEIRREEFINLSLSRQIDYLNGVCYPEECRQKNPPECLSYYAVYCMDDEEIEIIKRWNK